jgi:hypothetical protein
MEAGEQLAQPRLQANISNQIDARAKGELTRSGGRRKPSNKRDKPRRA